MNINSTKTKIVHYRNKSANKTRYPFHCGDHKIAVCDKYKYLGLWFSEHLDLSYMARQVAASAHRSLGLLIAKSKCADFSFECFTKLYDSLVQPIIDYGACVWGHSECKYAEGVQNRAMRFFLGVPCKTPTTAVIGEMGWLASHVRLWTCISRQWCHYSNMEDDRLNKHVFKWAVNSKSKNWASCCIKKFRHFDLDYVIDVQLPKYKQQVTQYVRKVLQEDYIQNTWIPDINRINAKRGVGLNKLRTYRLLKKVYETECYVKKLPFQERKSLALLRCGVAPIRLETGRYENGKYIPEEERICQVCQAEIENEIHVLLKCSLYEDLRMKLFDKANAINKDFINCDDTTRFIFLMSDMACNTAKTCKALLKRRKEYFSK